jgi:hypothetical protein
MTATLPAFLRPDCARCVALCCVAPAFDAEQGFGYDKPAREPCRHLHSDNRCGIHPALVAQGFSGCASFDCFGAGQRATARFADGDWRASSGQANRMFEAYSRLRTLHELLAMTTLAQPHAQGDAVEYLQQLLARLAQLCETDEPVDGVALRRQTLQQIQQALRGASVE